MWRVLLLVFFLGCSWLACSPNSTQGEGVLSEGNDEPIEIGEDASGFGSESVSLDSLPEQPPKTSFVLQSSAFKNNGSIPIRFGCEKDGSFQKPSIPLEWSGVPPGTKSFVLLMDDISPLGRQWVHWVVINIPATVTSLPEGASGDSNKMPKGAVELKNTWQQTGFGGPCPPTDVHAFRIRLFALSKATITLIESAQSTGIVEQLPDPIETAEIRGTYP